MVLVTTMKQRVCVCEGDGYIELNMEGERERAPFLVSLMLGARSQS